MNVFDFITQDELDELPEDPRLAFSTFVRHAQRRLNEHTRTLDGREEDQWYEIQEARHSFTNVVLAAGRRLEIEPFRSIDVPRIGKFDNDTYRQLVADIDHYMTQLVLDNSIRSRSDTVAISQSSRNKIKTYLHHLRECVRSSSLPDGKQQALFKKIDEFEEVLEKKRTNIVAVTRLAIEILAVPGAVWGSYEVVSKLIGNITQEVADAKTIDDEQNKFPVNPEVFAIEPPRRREEGSQSGRELDDEIPF